MTEDWRVVPGSDGKYWVSSHGTVWTMGKPRGQHGGGRLEGHALRPAPKAKAGYPAVCLYFDGKSTTRTVHSLVAEAFLGPRPAGHVVMKLNNDPGDNRPENLRYATRTEIDAYRRLTCG